MKLVILLTLMVTLSACDQKGSADSVKERAKAEQEAGTDVANQNQNNKARKMEEDLMKKYRFIQGTSGDFEGTFTSGEATFLLRLHLFPTLHIVDTGRIRNLEEIQDDLKNLGVLAQIEVKVLKTEQGIGGSTYDQIKPDYNNGIIRLVSAEEPLRYILSFSKDPLEAKEISSGLAEGAISAVDTLELEAYSKYGAKYKSTLVRTQEKQ